MAQAKIKNSIAEGLSPIYKNGKITPATKGLGPELEKNLKLKIKIMKEKITPIKKKSKEQPYIKNIKQLV